MDAALDFVDLNLKKLFIYLNKSYLFCKLVLTKRSFFVLFLFRNYSITVIFYNLPFFKLVWVIDLHVSTKILKNP